MSDDAWNPNQPTYETKPATLRTWLQQIDAVDNQTYNALVWPKDFETVRSLAHPSPDDSIQQVVVTDDAKESGVLSQFPTVVEENYLTHDLPEAYHGNFDVEIGGAFASDLRYLKQENDMCIDEALEYSLDTINRNLRSEGIAVVDLGDVGRMLDEDVSPEYIAGFWEYTTGGEADILNESYSRGGTGPYLKGEKP